MPGGKRRFTIVRVAMIWRHGNRPMLVPLASAVAVCLALSTACGSGRQLATNGDAQLRLAPVDLLVFAPHPDDEVIGAGGMLQRAVESGMRVLIVFVTNGDGYPKAASALLDRPIPALRTSDYVKLAAARQREAVAADHVLGVSTSNLVFLGYPDGVLARVYADAGDGPVQSPTTGRTMTCGGYSKSLIKGQGYPSRKVNGSSSALAKSILPAPATVAVAWGWGWL